MTNGDALRVAVIRAVAALDGFNPDTTPGGYWDKRVEPVMAAIRAATPADSLDVERLARGIATVNHEHRPEVVTDWRYEHARLVAAEYDRLRAEGSSKPPEPDRG